MSNSENCESIASQVDAGNVHSIGDWKLTRFLGRGGFGFTFKAENVKSNQIAAVKLFDKDGSVEKSIYSNFVSEYDAIDAVSSPYVVQVLGYGTQDDFNYIAMDFVQGYTLDAHILTYGPLNEIDFLEFAAQMLLGLSAIHDVGLGHHDIKPANIMRDERNSRWVLIDFGLAMVQHPAGVSEYLVQGTIPYATPELFAGYFSHASDVFAMGTVFYESIVGHNPWLEIAANIEAPNWFDRLRRAFQEHTADLGPVPVKFRELLSSMLRRNPYLRPNVLTLEKWILDVSSGTNPISLESFSANESTEFHDHENPVSKGASLQLWWENFSENLTRDFFDLGGPIRMVVESPKVAELTFEIVPDSLGVTVFSTIGGQDQAMSSFGWRIDTTQKFKVQFKKRFSAPVAIRELGEAIVNCLRFAWLLEPDTFEAHIHRTPN